MPPVNSSDLSVKVCNSIHQLTELADEWNQLVLAGSAEISLTYEWYTALEESHFSESSTHFKGSDLYYFTLYRGTRLAGVVPIFRERASFAKLPVTKLNFTSNAYCNHNDLIIDNEACNSNTLSGFLNSIQAEIGSWDFLEIDEVMADSPRMAAFERACYENGYTAVRHEISRSPFIPLEPDFNSFYEALRSADSRRKLRKLEKTLNEIEGYGIDHISDPDAMTQAMESILEIERSSWKHEQKSDITSHPVQISFYSRLADLASRRGWMKIALMSLESKPVAYEYNLWFGKKCFHLKGSYDSGQRKRSPSKVLKKNVLQTCCDGALNEYDYTGQEQEHKLEWTEKARKHERWYIFNRTLYGKILARIYMIKHLIDKT